MERWERPIKDLLAALPELEHSGVGFVSLAEALDLTSPAGRTMAGLPAVSSGLKKGRFAWRGDGYVSTRSRPECKLLKAFFKC